MLIYKSKFECTDVLNVVFLCGSNYNHKDPYDKRKILKEFVNNMGYSGLILEENFIMKNSSKKFLAYDDIFLKDLASVEQLTSLFASHIIIIHETISTAAEIGMFAINPQIIDKICLLVPDDISIEENKISNFIKLAFLNNNTLKRIPKVITYYPDIDVRRLSVNKSDYYTFFHDNKIGENLGTHLCCFLKISNKNKIINIKKSKYNKSSNENSNIEFYVDYDQLKVSVSTDALKTQLIALFFCEEFRREIRKKKKIYEHVSYIQIFYTNVLKNTIMNLGNKNIINLDINISIKNSNCELRQAIGYFLYLLQAIEFISLENDSGCFCDRKITIKNALNKLKDQYKDLITEKKPTDFSEEFK